MTAAAEMRFGKRIGSWRRLGESKSRRMPDHVKQLGLIAFAQIIGDGKATKAILAPWRLCVRPRNNIVNRFTCRHFPPRYFA